MGNLFLIFFLIALFSSLAWIFLRASPRAIANAFRLIVPGVLILTGGLLTVFGKGLLGLPLVAIGLPMIARARRVQSMGRAHGQSRKSSVRSAALEMELDHDSGDIDGFVLAGLHQGNHLSDLNMAELAELYRSLSGDGESLALLEAYLDRSTPTWREHIDPDLGAGQGASSGSGPMSEEEAYEVLGLSTSASTAEISEAHRRLMKRIHPDSGGSTFLAAKINEAKDTLLKNHR